MNISEKHEVSRDLRPEVKAQVLAGGRGLGYFKEPAPGRIGLWAL